MTKNNVAFTSGQVEKAAVALIKLRPAYTTLLDFYKHIFVAQEDSRNRIVIEPIPISAERISVKAKEKFPLITMSEFVIDVKEATKLFRTICNIAEESSEEMKGSVRGIIIAVDAGKLDLNTLFTGFLGEDDLLFEKISDDCAVKAKVLSFITYNSIKPSLSVCASQLSSYLRDENQPWEKGYCPVCGGPPMLSTFEENGNRFLFCSFCGHKWHVQRIYCPFCDNKDNKTLRYFKSAEEQEYRLDVCDKCKKYIKAVDTREVERIIYPPLENVSTLHLDIKAQELGFESGTQLDLNE
jgi:FdhE protein